MQPFLGCRFTHDAYHALLQELDEKAYKNFLRMTDSHFNCCSTKCGQVLQGKTWRCVWALHRKSALQSHYDIWPQMWHRIFSILR